MKKTIQFFFLFTVAMAFKGCSEVNLVVADSHGLLEHVSSFKGEKAVLLNVWALWCVPCVDEFPMIVDLENEIDELEVVFISADFDDQVDAVKDFLGNQGVKDVSFYKKEKDESFINGLHPQWTGSLPFTVIYAKTTGEIVDFWEGKKPESQFRHTIEHAIKHMEEL